MWADGVKAGLRGGPDAFEEGIAVAVHGDYAGEILHLELPAGFGGAELIQEMDTGDALDACGDERRRASHGLKIDRAVLPTGSKGRRIHATFAYDQAHASGGYESWLVGIFADARCWAGCDDLPAVPALHDNRSAVEQRTIAEIDWQTVPRAKLGSE